MNHSLTKGQAAVLRAFYEYGRPMDDLALTVYVHHTLDAPISSSGIRSRRAELSKVIVDEETGDVLNTPLLQIVGTHTLKSGRSAAIHALTAEGEDVADTLFGSVAATV